MANYDVLKVDGSKSGSVELNDAVFLLSNLIIAFYLKLSTYNVRHYAKVLTLLRIVQQYVVVDVNHGDKRQVVHVKVQSVRHNGVVVV